MIEKIKSLIRGYAGWMEKETVLDQTTEEWVEITLPFLNHHDNYVSVLVRNVGGRWEMTDPKGEFREIARGAAARNCGHDFVRIVRQNFSLVLTNISWKA